MDFSNIASVAGKRGLFKVVKLTHTGFVLEALDETKKKLVTSMQTKVSVLSKVSIFTTDGDGAVPLIDVMQKVYAEFKESTNLDKNSAIEQLKSFLKHILPNYDENRVYVSDIKKLVTWYNQLVQIVPELLILSEKSKKEQEVKTKNTATVPQKKHIQNIEAGKIASKNTPSVKIMNRKTQ